MTSEALTVSMDSPLSLSLSFFLSRAFALAVVDKTAVVTFVGASFEGGLVSGGYAKRLGRAFDTNSNLGAL